MRDTVLRMLALLVFVLCLMPEQGEAHAGWGIAVDHEGRVVFLDSLRNRVWRMEKDGQLSVLASGIHANPLVPDAEGNFYAEDFNENLWRISPDGRKTKIRVPAHAGMTGGRVGSLDELIAVDAEGNLYFHTGNDFRPQPPQILKLTPKGEWSVLAGGATGHADGRGSEARFQQIYSAAWGPDGALYVADQNSVRRVAMDGTVTTVAGGEAAGFTDGPRGAAQFDRIFSVAVDAQGNVIVADSDNFRVRKIASNGEVTTLLRTIPPWKPAGVTVATGAVYVLERQFVPGPVSMQIRTTTHRVRRIAPDGSVETLAAVSGGAPTSALLLLAVTGVLGVWGLFRWRRKRKSAR